MKTGGAKGSYIHKLVSALERADYELLRRNSSHFIYQVPGRPQIVIVPQKLDDPILAKSIAKRAGAHYDAK